MQGKIQLATKILAPDLPYISPPDGEEELFRCLRCGRALFKGIIISIAIRCKRCGAYNLFSNKPGDKPYCIKDTL